MDMEYLEVLCRLVVVNSALDRQSDLNKTSMCFNLVGKSTKPFWVRMLPEGKENVQETFSVISTYNSVFVFMYHEMGSISKKKERLDSPKYKFCFYYNQT